MRRWIPWLMVLVLVGLGGLVLARWVVAQGGMDNNLGDGLSGKSVAPTLPANIVSEDRIFDPQLDPQSRESLSEKILMETRKAEDQSAGEVDPAPKDQLPPTPTVDQQLLANQSPPSGIYNGSEGMIKPEQAQINNYWQGVVNGNSIMVMAGSEPQDTSSGMVIVVTSDGFSVTGFETIPAPAGVSSLTVVDATDTTLILEDLDGTQVTFDLQTQTFVE